MCWLEELPWILDFFDQHAERRLGFLPEAGGINDQDVRFVEAMRIIDEENALISAREAKEAERKRKREATAAKARGNQRWRRRTTS